MLLVYLIYNSKKLNRYSIIKYLKVYINKGCILIVVISSIISNSYLLILNSKYNNVYNNLPETINLEAIVIRR